MFTIVEDRWKIFGHHIIWNRNDKIMVRDVIYTAFQGSRFPKGLDLTLTRINWSKAYVKNNILFISINISSEASFSMDFVSHPNCPPTAAPRMYSSQRIFLQIPFSGFRDYKLKKLISSN
jgi:hypothetical protein